WTRAQELLESGESMLRERCTGVAWELHASQLYSLRCLCYLGRARDVEKRLVPLLDDVRRRGDLFLETALRTIFVTFLAVSRDDPEQARSQLEQPSELRPLGRFTLQHFWELEARVLLALYLGEGATAHEAWQRRVKDFRRSGLSRIQH